MVRPRTSLKHRPGLADHQVKFTNAPAKPPPNLLFPLGKNLRRERADVSKVTLAVHGYALLRPGLQSHFVLPAVDGTRCSSQSILGFSDRMDACASARR